MTAPLTEQELVVCLPAPDPHLATQCSRERNGSYGGLTLGPPSLYRRQTKMVSFTHESAGIGRRGDLLVPRLSDSDGRLR